MHDAPAALAAAHRPRWQWHGNARPPDTIQIAVEPRTRRPYPALTRLICHLDLDLDRTTPRGAGARAEEPGAPEEPRGVPGAVSARVRIVLGLPAPRC